MRLCVVATLLLVLSALPQRGVAQNAAVRPRARASSLTREDVRRELDSLRRRLARLERMRLDEGRAVDEEALQERVEELERSDIARADATRNIIREALATVGSQINELVSFGGALELALTFDDFAGPNSSPQLQLGTAEFEFDIKPADWAQGAVVFAYADGQDGSLIERITVDTAVARVGDPQRFWAYAVLGRMVVPFGISTGDPVADVLTIDDPLTVDVFETKKNAVLFGFEFPTPALAPEPIPSTHPPVRPLVLAPLVGSVAELLGYEPPPAPPVQPSYTFPSPTPPPFRLGVYVFAGDTYDDPADQGRFAPQRHMGATAGYRLRSGLFSLDLNVNWISSVFESGFLVTEYESFLAPIGLVGGAGANVKMSLGPFSLVAEWNAALSHAEFVDDAGENVRIRPGAWQVSAAFQAGWNPSVESIGAQGTYVGVSYSESYDLAGVVGQFGEDTDRFGAVPKRRFLANVGEWVLDGIRLAAQYSYEADYSADERGTGRVAHGMSVLFTLEW